MRLSVTTGTAPSAVIQAGTSLHAPCLSRKESLQLKHRALRLDHGREQGLTAMFHVPCETRALSALADVFKLSPQNSSASARVQPDVAIGRVSTTGALLQDTNTATKRSCKGCQGGLERDPQNNTYFCTLLKRRASRPTVQLDFHRAEQDSRIPNEQTGSPTDGVGRLAC